MEEDRVKRILLSIPEGAWKIIEEGLKGKIGENDSEIIRNIVLAYLSEKGYMKAKTARKREMQETQSGTVGGR